MSRRLRSERKRASRNPSSVTGRLSLERLQPTMAPGNGPVTRVDVDYPYSLSLADSTSQSWFRAGAVVVRRRGLDCPLASLAARPPWGARIPSAYGRWFRQAQPACGSGGCSAHGVVSTVHSLRSLLDHLGFGYSSVYGRVSTDHWLSLAARPPGAAATPSAYGRWFRQAQPTCGSGGRSARGSGLDCPLASLAARPPWVWCWVCLPRRRTRVGFDRLNRRVVQVAVRRTGVVSTVRSLRSLLDHLVVWASFGPPKWSERRSTPPSTVRS